jgi:hypothetical protein
MEGAWKHSMYGNPYIRIGDRTITVFKKRGTEQWYICCHVGGTDGHTVYHRRSFACKNDALDAACKLFKLSRPVEVEDPYSLEALRDRVLARTK